MSSLDLFSTSQTNGAFPFAETCASFAICSYHAPYFAFQREKKAYGVTQGCCNHWDCPKCGVLRAKKEYGRIVSGCELLSKNRSLFFITITCRGKTLGEDAAMDGYLEWTNRFLSAARAKANREDQDWYYVQVTEKQKRGHPHSHILTTFDVGDMYIGRKFGWKTIGKEKVWDAEYAFRSNWLAKAVVRAGLGDQYDVSVVTTAAAASRYVAKYMFKDSMFGTHWRKGWKRVRYSQSFPPLPQRETNAFVLLSQADWHNLARIATVITTDSEQTKAEVLYRLSGNDILVG